jgi:hypothetical protein
LDLQASAIGVTPSIFLDLEPVAAKLEALLIVINQFLQNRDVAQLLMAFRVAKAILVG